MKKSNVQIIADMLLSGKSVNTIGAVTGKYGRIMLRLSDIIFRLRNEGMLIKTIDVKNKTNQGYTAKYILDTQYE